MPLPQDITYYLGQGSTGQRQTISIDPSQPFTIGAHQAYLNPNKHQLLAWVNQNAAHVPTRASRFGHNEKAVLPNWVTFLGATESSQGTSSLVFDRVFPLPTRLARVGSNPEVILCPATSSWTGTTLNTVVRNFGRGNTGSFLQYAEKLKLIGGGVLEGRTLGTGPSSIPNWSAFRTGIIDYPVTMTGTKAAEDTTEGGFFSQMLFENWEKANDEVESGILFSAPVDDDSTFTTPMHCFTGLLSWVSFNSFSVGAPLTRDWLDQMIFEWVAYNKAGGAIVCSSVVGQLLANWGEQKLVYNDELMKIGAYVKRYQSSAWAEPFDLIYCDLLSQHPDLMGKILFLPKTTADQGMARRPLIGVKDRELRYIPDPTRQPRVDEEAGTIFGEFGYEWISNETFALATDIQF